MASGRRPDRPGPGHLSTHSAKELDGQLYWNRKDAGQSGSRKEAAISWRLGKGCWANASSDDLLTAWSGG